MPSIAEGSGALQLLLLSAGAPLLILNGCKPESPGTPAPEPPTLVSAPAASGAPAPSASAPPTGVAPPPAACLASESRSTTARDARNKAGAPRIVGGRPSRWPWAVALTADGSAAKQFCGGSLIGRDAVLTAAHCQVRRSDKVIVGRSDLRDAMRGKVVALAAVKNHAAYDPDTHDNDLAVLKLAEPVDLETVGLFDGSAELAGRPTLVVGWGYTQEGGPPSSKLLEVEVPAVSNAVCSAGYASDRVGITDNMLCAGLAQGGKDSCQGDSGGPLVVQGADGKWKQAGVVSFGVGCARPDKYGVYARVANYLPWIEACAR